MTVQELIDQLANFSPDSKIGIPVWVGDPQDFNSKIEMVEIDISNNHTDEMIFIRPKNDCLQYVDSFNSFSDFAV